MNRKSILKTTLLFVAVCGFFFSSAMAQADIYKKALSAKYPNAQNVEWEAEDGYMTAEFLGEHSQEVEVWFDMKGNWVRTKTDMLFKHLPEVIKKAYQSSQYAKWRIDDIDFIEKPTEESIYIIEVEKMEQEHKLIVSEKGVIFHR